MKTIICIAILALLVALGALLALYMAPYPDILTEAENLKIGE